MFLKFFCLLFYPCSGVPQFKAFTVIDTSDVRHDILGERRSLIERLGFFCFAVMTYVI